MGFKIIRPKDRWLRVGDTLVKVTTDRRGNPRLVVSAEIGTRVEWVNDLPTDANAELVNAWRRGQATEPH